MEAILKEIKDDVATLQTSVNILDKKLTWICVKNGGGMTVKLKFEEFMQKVFEKPDHKDVTAIVTKAVKNAPINSMRIIIRDVTLIGGMILVLLKLFGVL
jgi:hypothetical protein